MKGRGRFSPFHTCLDALIKGVTGLHQNIKEKFLMLASTSLHYFTRSKSHSLFIKSKQGTQTENAIQPQDDEYN